MMHRTPQQQNTTYFRQAATGAYIVPQAKTAAIPRVRTFADGSLGDPLSNLARRQGKGPVPLKGIGSFLMTSPLLDAMKGLGEVLPGSDPASLGPNADDFDDSATDAMAVGGGIIAAAIIARLAIGGFFSYKIGQAIAPSASEKSTYGLWAIPVGIVSPYIGLGIMSMYALGKK